MSFQIAHWETHLLDLAQQGIEGDLQEEQSKLVDSSKLTLAYAHCDELTRTNSKTFYMASSFVSAEKVRALRALYAFCRVSDDVVDKYEGNKQASLEDWRQQNLRISHSSSLVDETEYYENQDANSSSGFFPELVALAWEDTCRKYRIPRIYAEQLICGVAEDIGKKRYDTFQELTTYCYGVACTVGLMSMHIIGYEGPQAFPYAIRLGVALQLTNILRDVGEDWRMGRLYLPKEEMDRFGISEEQIAAGIVDRSWVEFMRFQIDKTRKLYAESLPGVKLLEKDGRFAITAAAELYKGILDDIESNGYDVFTRRAHLSKIGKIRRLPGIWWRSRM